MIDWKPFLPGLTTGVLIAQLATVAWAQDPVDKGGTAAPTMADFNKLQAEVREQRQFMMEMLQSEQQRYDMLLKLIRAQSGGVIPDSIRLPSGPLGTKTAAPDAPVADAARTPAPAGAAEPARRNAVVAGRVDVGGGDTSDVYVFIENVKGAPARGKTVEIKQEGKQFSPRLAVVQIGTNVVFPNFDSVYHNVFSNSPRNSFDLGSSRAGDKPRSVTLSKPGVVEIFCNMHQKMTANVLVVPSPLYAKVRSDGTFRIDHVPLGSRKVVAWSPRAQATEQRIDLTTAGAQLTFALKGDERKAHLNKLGQAYGSYRD